MASTIVAWDAIHKFITLRGGKYGPVPVPILSNNPSKAYPEFAKTNKKKLQSLTNKIMASIDDMRKAKVAHQKNIDQYHRMITEAEGLIKTRDSVGEGEMAPIQDGVGKDDTFMNRSFTKMFTKNTPNDKKERLRDLIREIDVAESQIRANATRLNNCRNSLIDELSKAWEEVNATETRRLNTFKEGITVFTLTWNSWTESKKQCMATVLEAIQNVSLDDSIKNFISEIDTVQPFPVLQDTDGAMDYAPSEVGDYFAQLYSRIDKISDNLEKIKIFASKSVQLLQDAADLHHACGKSIYKVFEKYGFRQSNPMEVSDQRNLVEVFGTKDSPLIANAWLKWSALYGETVEFNFRNADFYVDNLCQKLTLAQRSVEQQKKNLVEKNFAYAKRHETIQGTYVKLLTKLNKVQKDLNERKSALKKAKEDLDTGNPSTTTAAITDLPGTDASPDKTADESGDWKLSLDDSSVVVTEETESTSATGDATEKKKNASNMMQNLSSSLRSRKLSAVVGFESPEDRISRIEVKVLALEEEEKELILGMESTVVEMNNLLKEAIRELAANCQLAQDYMLSDLSTVRTVLNSLRDWHQKEIKQDIDIVAIASTLCDRIDISHDLNIFQQVINDKYKEAATIDTSLIADIPAIEVFEAYSSTALDEERRIYVANAHRESPARRSRSGTDVEASPAELVGGEAHKSTTSETSELRDGSIESKAVQSLSLVEEKDEYDREDPDVDFDSNREALFSREDEENEIDTKANVNVTETSLNASSLEDRERISSIPDDLESLDPRNTTNSVASTDTRRSKRVVSVRNTLITPPQKMDSGTLSELHKFGLDANDKVIESFSCALYPKKGLLTHGRYDI